MKTNTAGRAIKSYFGRQARREAELFCVPYQRASGRRGPCERPAATHASPVEPRTGSVLLGCAQDRWVVSWNSSFSLLTGRGLTPSPQSKSMSRHRCHGGTAVRTFPFIGPARMVVPPWHFIVLLWGAVRAQTNRFDLRQIRCIFVVRPAMGRAIKCLVQAARTSLGRGRKNPGARVLLTHGFAATIRTRLMRLSRLTSHSRSCDITDRPGGLGWRC